MRKMTVAGLSLFALGAAAGAAGDARIITFCGYSDCVSIGNGECRVVLGPDCGGRVLEYSLNGVNTLHLDPSQDGWVYNPADGKKTDPMGGRFDIGPEFTLPARPKLWLGPWTAAVTGPLSARMTSVRDDATGIQIIRDFTLSEKGSRLLVRNTYKNTSGSEVQICHWSRTCAVPGGVCFISSPSKYVFPKKYAVYDGANVIIRPSDPAILADAENVIVKQLPQKPKLAFHTDKGRLAYLMRNNLLFLKKFKLEKDALYHDGALPLNLCVYYHQNFCELEPLSPVKTLGPDGNFFFDEEWELIPFEFPKDMSDENLRKLAKETEAR